MAAGCRSLQFDGSEIYSSAPKIGILGHASFSQTIYTGAGGVETMPRPLIRKKTIGLNTRFDRMLAQVNITHPFGSASKTHKKRARSSGSSSVSSYDLPKTPVDAYSHLYKNGLGGNSSMLKITKRASNSSKFPLLVQHESDIFKAHRKGSQAQTPMKALPSWLASTFSALEPEHPLRELLPPSPVHEDEMETITQNDPPRPSPQESFADRIFAFSPFDADPPAKNDAFHETSLHPPAGNPTNRLVSRNPTNVNAEIQVFHVGEDSFRCRPFSTPGSRAVLQHSSISGAGPDFAYQSESQHSFAHVNRHILTSDTSLSVSRANFAPSPVLRRIMPEPETSLSSLYHGSSIASGAIPNLLTPNFQENELTMNIFSTPGPTVTVAQPVYFGSPTEDPSLSDSLEPGPYELDLNALDFHWQPFLRKTFPALNLVNQPTSNMRASDMFHCISEEPDCPSHSPDYDCGIADEHAVQTEAPDARIEYDHGPFRDSPVADHIIQQPSSPQLNGQSRIGIFAPASGIFISPLLNAISSPVLLGVDDVEDKEIKAQGPTVSPDEERFMAFQPDSPKLVSADNTGSITESNEHPFTPPRSTQPSQPATPKKDRPSQIRGTQHPPPNEQRSAVSWMLSRRSFAMGAAIDYEELDELPSQRSDTSHDSIESWTDPRNINEG